MNDTTNNNGANNNETKNGQVGTDLSGVSREARQLFRLAEELGLRTIIVRSPDSALPGDVVGVVTHSGPFHADEAVAIAALSIVHPETWVWRTREVKLLALAAEALDVIVVDVGGEYRPGRNNFDHHQVGGAGGRPSRMGGAHVPYASAGLVWERYGAAIIEAACGELWPQVAPHVGDIWAHVDRMMAAIDALDNGWEKPHSESGEVDWSAVSITALIGACNPLQEFLEVDFDSHFREVVELVAPVIRRVILTAAAAAVSGERVKDAVRMAISLKRPYVTLQAHAGDWSKTILATLGAEGVMYCIFPSDGTWMVQQVPAAAGTFAGRLPLPLEWAGLRGVELDDILPEEVPEGAVFCHSGRFIAGHSTFEGACKMAEVAVAMGALGR